MQDKKKLEESLWMEVLANEEQWNYIEILKQALEAKMEQLGVTDLFNQYANRKASSIDLFAEMSHLKKTADTYWKEYLRKEGEAQDSEAKLEMERMKNEKLA